MNTFVNGFVYVWHNTSNGKKYIGVHKGTPCDGYICSSKRMLEDYNKEPSAFHREIIYVGEYQSAIDLETKLLKQIDAKQDPNYYNMHNGDGKFYKTSGDWSQESRNKLSTSLKGKVPSNKGMKMTEEQKVKLRVPKSEEHKEKLRRPKSKEHKEKLRQANLGKKASQETKAKISLSSAGKKWSQNRYLKPAPFSGKKHTEETKKKMRETKARMKTLNLPIQSQQ
jgi:hypothetical protein